MLPQLDTRVYCVHAVIYTCTLINAMYIFRPRCAKIIMRDYSGFAKTYIIFLQFANNRLNLAG